MGDSLRAFHNIQMLNAGVSASIPISTTSTTTNLLILLTYIKNNNSSKVPNFCRADLHLNLKGSPASGGMRGFWAI